jgi:hypothetical protein
METLLAAYCGLYTLCKQRPFLGNGSVNTFSLLGNRFLIMQKLDATIEELCFSVVRAEIYARDKVSCQFPRVEAGSNTSTVTLRVVRGDEKGSLKSEAVKYGRESQGTRTRE